MCKSERSVYSEYISPYEQVTVDFEDDKMHHVHECAHRSAYQLSQVIISGLKINPKATSNNENEHNGAMTKKKSTLNKRT